MGGRGRAFPVKRRSRGKAQIWMRLNGKEWLILLEQINEIFIIGCYDDYVTNFFFCIWTVIHLQWVMRWEVYINENNLIALSKGEYIPLRMEVLP